VWLYLHPEHDILTDAADKFYRVPELLLSVRLNKDCAAHVPASLYKWDSFFTADITACCSKYSA
jgi:hypothetical protein